MKQLIVLLKAEYRDTFKLNQIRFGKDEKLRKKQTRQMVGFGVIAVFLAVSMYGYFAAMATVFKDSGRPELTLAVACFAASLVTVVTTVFHAKNVLIAFRDYDAVMSMPVSGYTVTLSRVAKLYTSNIFYILFVMAPAAAAYLTFSGEGVGVWFFVALIIATLFLPLLPIAISGVLGLLIGTATVGFKRKNLASIILSFIFIIVWMGVSFFSSSMIANIAEIAPKLSAAVEGVYPPAIWYGEALLGDIGKLGLFILVNILPFAAFTAAVGALFRKLNAVMTRQRRFVMKKERMERKSPLTALYRKELRRYFSSSLYVSNTALGGLLLIIGAVVVAVFAKTRLEPFFAEPAFVRMIDSAAPFAPSLFAALSCTTAASISMEREKLWQLKAMPVDVKDVFRSKLFVSFSVMLPAIIVACPVLCAVLPVSAYTMAMLFIMPIVYMAFMGVLGLTMDLRMAKLNWQSEAEVIKQGMPTMVVALGGLAMGIIPAIVCAVTGIKWLTAAWAAVLVILTLIMWSGLMKKGPERFLKLG